MLMANKTRTATKTPFFLVCSVKAKKCYHTTPVRNDGAANDVDVRIFEPRYLVAAGAVRIPKSRSSAKEYFSRFTAAILESAYRRLHVVHFPAEDSVWQWRKIRYFS